MIKVYDYKNQHKKYKMYVHVGNKRNHCPHWVAWKYESLTKKKTKWVSSVFYNSFSNKINSFTQTITNENKNASLPTLNLALKINIQFDTVYCII